MENIKTQIKKKRKDLNTWFTEGVNSIAPTIYKEYLIQLYNLEKYGLEKHEFLDAISSSLSFTPFSTEKVLSIKDRLSKGEKVNKLEIDISDVCNFKCPGCTFQYSYNGEQINPQALYAFINEIKLKGFTAITLVGGGEPSLYKQEGENLVTVVENLAKEGIEVFLITNGFSYTDEQIMRIVRAVKGIRVSYYNFIAPGEPQNKNEIVDANIKKFIKYIHTENQSCFLMVGNLVSYASQRDYKFTLELSRKFGIPITPRPYISIKRNAYSSLEKSKTIRLLDRALECYEEIEPFITKDNPIAAREFLERVLAYNLPLEKKCTVTELGLTGKLRANGDLYRCGQLSAKSYLINNLPNRNDFYTNIYNDVKASVDNHVKGIKGLTSNNICPVCRETLNNVRLNNFDNLPNNIKQTVLNAVLQAYEDGKNLGNFW
ncbi:radical SAM protein [Caldifermentibacillus hisashii]|uniref:Radical SAM protein n=1 Tax=Caldifermentibacillus hisashii TaxID=996558 RepID=A0ABU9JUD2_9BACI